MNKEKTKTIYIKDKDDDTKSRRIYLFEEIKLSIIRDLIKKILDMQKSKKPITLYINSPGGYTDAGFALIDVMKNSKCIIRTIAVGEICSMAPAIFVSGSKGYRYISEHSYIMFHPLKCGHNDYVRFVDARLMSAKKLDEMFDKLILENTNIPKRIYTKAKNSELWISSTEAVKYGIADKIWDKIL